MKVRISLPRPAPGWPLAGMASWVIGVKARSTWITSCGDCDTVDSLQENTKIYLYDGSPIVLRKAYGEDPIPVSTSVFLYSGSDNKYTFKPFVDKIAPIFSYSEDTVAGRYYRVRTGQFLTTDEKVAVERTSYAPLTTDSGVVMWQRPVST